MNLENLNISKKLAQLLLTSPQLQQLVKDEAEQQRTDAMQARLDCLQRFKQVQNELEAAQQRQQEAVQALDAVRSVWRDKEAAALLELAVATDASNSAGHRYSLLSTELNREHGEDRANIALRTLHGLMINAGLKRDFLEKNRYEVTAWGTRVERKGVKAQLDELDEFAPAFIQSESELRALLLSDTAPHEIEQRVARIMKKYGVVENKPLEDPLTH